ncbi:hypothetical protein [Glaciibacter psychrotolerans]|uniref:Di/tricarboxylate transporter n=1 Tax=Glaciibacter psychrotolerans TaxID=670054 RepID=A0A7Z0EFQ7_9MICO|nr:hypothetical protein [Leifsonia psychrotolerans]NYJ20683.1 di/tricarboxylate transporter [Leifsonia psychrotolerans]
MSDTPTTPLPNEQPTVPLTTLRTDADAAAAESHAPPAPAPTADSRHRPLFATIFWGVLLLAFAGFMVVRTVLPAAPDPTLWLLSTVIVIGLALVVAGIAAASRRAG